MSLSTPLWACLMVLLFNPCASVIHQSSLKELGETEPGETSDGARAGLQTVSGSFGVVGVCALEFQGMELIFKTVVANITSVPATNIQLPSYEEADLGSSTACVTSVNVLLFGIDQESADEAKTSLKEAKSDGSFQASLEEKSGVSGLELITLEEPSIGTATPPATSNSDYSSSSSDTGTYVYPWAKGCCQPVWSECCPYKQATVSCCYPNWSSCCPYSQEVYSACSTDYVGCGFTPSVTYYDSPAYYTYYWLQHEKGSTSNRKIDLVKLARKKLDKKTPAIKTSV